MKNLLVAALYGLLSVRFFYLLYTHQILDYVNGRWLWLMIIGWTIFGLLSLRALWTRQAHASWAVIILLIGLIVLPVRALEPTHTLTLSPQNDNKVTTVVLPADTASYSFSDWYKYRDSGRPQADLEGKTFTASGYLSGADQSAKTLELSRLVITCCIADAFQTSFTIDYQQLQPAPSLVSDDWYQVTGVWHQNSDQSWVIVASAMTPIPAPHEPYVYP